MPRIVACLIALLLPSLASAKNEVALRISNQFVADRGYTSFSGDANLAQLDLGYARRVITLKRGELWVEGGFMIGERGGRALGRFETRLLAQQITFGARFALPLRPWLVPYLRAGGGVLVGRLQLETAKSGQAEMWSAAGTGHALLGVALLLPRRRGTRDASELTAGLSVEGGGTLSSNLGFSMRPGANDDELRIPSSGTDLGALALSGGVFRVGAFLRF